MGVGLIWLRLKRACCAANASMTAVFPIGRSWPANCAPGNAGAIATRQLLSGASPWMMPGSSSSVFILQSTIDGLLAPIPFKYGSALADVDPGALAPATGFVQGVPVRRLAHQTMAGSPPRRETIPAVWEADNAPTVSA